MGGHGPKGSGLRVAIDADFLAWDIDLPVFGDATAGVNVALFTSVEIDAADARLDDQLDIVGAGMLLGVGLSLDPGKVGFRCAIRTGQHDRLFHANTKLPFRLLDGPFA